MSRERSHYPRDLDGGKNEWKALIKHYEEFDLKANMLEKYAKGVVQENIRNELLQQKVEFENRKKAEKEE